MKSTYIKAKELAEKWNVTPRRINQLCADGMLPGSCKEGKFWLIPNDVDKPAALRKKPSVMINHHPDKGTLLPCPVGITSYKEASTDCYYVDKTLLLKDMIDDHSKVYLFTRPRRFGKTLTLDMIRTYFEITAEDTASYFQNKNIWKCDETYRSLQGKYPVVFLSFKDAHHKTYEETYKSICFCLREEYIRHLELQTSEFINPYDKQYFDTIVSGKATVSDYQFALGKLSSMLRNHYKQKVIILIDEYDTPLQQGHIHGFYDEIISFIRNLFSAALKDNFDLEFGVLTGILRIAKESLFSGLNNLVVNSILDNKYAEYFGFTEEDVREMCAYYGVTQKLSEIKDWYNGYMFGNKEIYNPWSVISYFNNQCVPKAFWSRTSGNEIIGQLIQKADKDLYQSLTLLLQDKTVQSIIDTDIIYPEIHDNPDVIYSFLLVAGYLRVREITGELNGTPICTLSIPNKEIKSVFQKEILDVCSRNFTGSILRNFELSLRNKDTSLFTNTMEQYLLQSASTFDTSNENFYHGTVFGMLAIMSDKFYIFSNRESGEGRFDISLEPHDKSGAGYIIEFKSGKNLTDTELNAAAEKAMNQIKTKNYMSDMRYRGIRKFELFGIAFSGKHLACKHEQWND